MLAKIPSNELYFAVLPLIHLGTGQTEQALTLVTGRDFATEFFPDEVEQFITFFENRMGYLTGRHVTGYEIYRENTDDGRVVVRVVQNVS